MEFKITKPNKPINSDLFAEANEGCSLFERDGELYISGVETQAQADALLAAHNPPAPTEPTAKDKLASVGLSLADLKSALGL